MSTFQKVTKLGSAPLAAAAIATTTTANLLGRPTTSRTTHQLANANSKHLQTLIQHYCQRGNSTATTATLVKFSHPNSVPLSCNNYQHPVSILARRNLTSAKPSTPKQQSTASVNQSGSNAAGGSGTSNSSKNKSFMEWYEGHLQTRPVQTKMVTGSILWGLGDVVAQVVPQVFFDNNNQNDDDAKKESSTAMKEFAYDYPRTARAMIFGFGIHAPLSHVHYNFLEWMTVRGGFTGLSIPVFKAFMEQFVYWSWFSNSLYHGAMGAMQGKSLQQVYDRIADVLWETQKAQWVFWIPVQLLNFQFVPVRHQLNVVLLTSVVWTALLSAWYPPEDEVDAIEEETKTKET